MIGVIGDHNYTVQELWSRIQTPDEQYQQQVASFIEERNFSRAVETAKKLRSEEQKRIFCIKMMDSAFSFVEYQEIMPLVLLLKPDGAENFTRKYREMLEELQWELLDPQEPIQISAPVVLGEKDVESSEEFSSIGAEDVTDYDSP